MNGQICMQNWYLHIFLFIIPFFRIIAIAWPIYLFHIFRHFSYQTAKEEGFDKIAYLFESVAKIEKEHEERYLKLLDNVENGNIAAICSYPSFFALLAK